jgi:lysophospholipase L1-like esterase
VFVPEPKTFVARLRQHAPDVEVLNAGVGGYTSTQELGLVVHKLIDLEPDLVISFSGWNDVYDNVSRALMDAEARGGTPGDLRITGNFLSLEERLVNYRRLQEEPLLALLEALHTITRSSTLLSAVSSVFSGGLERQPPAHLPAEWRRALIELHVGNLLKLRDLVEARGGRLIAVTQPEVSQLQRPGLERRSNPDFLPGDHYWEVFPDLYQEFRAGVGQALEARAATWLDASAALAPRVRSARTPLFLDPVHLSPAGHETMAALLIEPMRRGLREARGRDRRPAP